MYEWIRDEFGIEDVTSAHIDPDYVVLTTWKRNKEGRLIYNMNRQEIETITHTIVLERP